MSHLGSETRMGQRPGAGARLPSRVLDGSPASELAERRQQRVLIGAAQRVEPIDGWTCLRARASMAGQVPSRATSTVPNTASTAMTPSTTPRMSTFSTVTGQPFP